MARSITNIAAKNTNTTVYCLLRYAFAPALIEEAIFFILSVPSGNFIIFFAVNTANNNAAKAPKRVKPTKYLSKKTHPFSFGNAHYTSITKLCQANFFKKPFFEKFPFILLS